MSKQLKPSKGSDESRDEVGEGIGPEVAGEPKISPIQQQAISLMMGGSNLTDTARTVRISRGTLYYWLRRDPAFIAAYNGWRADLTRSTRARLLALCDSAVKAISTAVDKGDAHLALKLLKNLDVLTPEPPGSDDPAIVEGNITLGQQEERQELGKRYVDVLTSQYIEWTPTCGKGQAPDKS